MWLWIISTFCKMHLMLTISSLIIFFKKVKIWAEKTEMSIVCIIVWNSLGFIESSKTQQRLKNILWTYYNMNKKYWNHLSSSWLTKVFIQKRKSRFKCDYRKAIIDKWWETLNCICVDHRSFRIRIRQEARGHLL